MMKRGNGSSEGLSFTSEAFMENTSAANDRNAVLVHNVHRFRGRFQKRNRLAEAAGPERLCLGVWNTLVHGQQRPVSSSSLKQQQP